MGDMEIGYNVSGFEFRVGIGPQASWPKQVQADQGENNDHWITTPGEKIRAAELICEGAPRYPQSEVGKAETCLRTSLGIRENNDELVKQAFMSYRYEGCPAEELILGSIKAGKISYDLLLWIALTRTGHYKAVREAAIEKIKSDIKNVSIVFLEGMVEVCKKEYYNEGVPAEKLLIAAIESGRLSKKTLLEFALDNNGHHSKVRKAAQDQLNN